MNDFANGLEEIRAKQESAAVAFPIGSDVRRNVMGSEVSKVVGHKGNMLELENGKLIHVTKAVKVSPP